MAEGGAFPWKRQVIDESRGPAGSYKSIHQSLPDLPDGVAWHKNETTKEWTLIRINQQQQERASQQYRLERTTVWNPNTGREQLSVKPVLKEKTTKETDTSTVATTTSDYDGGDVEEDSDNTPPVPAVGRDYVVHTVLPSDTFSGLCLRYKINATTLRRVNQFSGTNLALAPAKLLIPLLGGMTLDKLKLQDTNSTEYKMQLLLTEFPSLAAVERKAYLEMNDWDVTKTIEEIKQDTEWEQNHICVAVPLEIESK